MTTPKAHRRWFTRPWAIVPTALIAVFGGLWWAIAEHYRPAPWQYAASAMGPEFQALVLNPEPDLLSTRSRPIPTDFGANIDYPWEIELDEVRVEATYARGQTLDDIEHRTRTAAATLGLLAPLCDRFADERAYRFTGRRATTGHALICNVYDTEHHPVGLVIAWDDDPVTRIALTMSPDGAGRVAPGIGPKNLPDR